jgi:squalene-hopene/tetraprenyl-beta-curcumene cyclase
MVVASDRLSAAAESLARAADHLLGRQDAEGWWKGELETNVTMDAEDLLLRQFLGIRTPQTTARAAAWIRSQQRQDGTWATFHGGPGDLSTTVEAYVALRLAGDRPEADHLQTAARWVREHGGVAGTRVFTRIWLALFGQWSWDELPVLPPEVMLLPPSVPLNIYDFACWARQTIVALTVVSAYRPVRELPFGLAELRASQPGSAAHSGSAGRSRSADRRSVTSRAFLQLNRLLATHERLRHKPLRARALARAESWIVRRQEADGSWGGIQPPWVYSLIALHLRGYGLDHPVMRAGLEGLERFVIDDGHRRLEACQSPVWDTALAVVALADAGLEADDPALVRAADWLIDQEITVGGDWSVRRPDLAPGGWAFEFHNDNYPDVDDTAEVVLALQRVRHPRPDVIAAAVSRAVNWVAGMQCRDGGWAAFDVDNSSRLCAALPFCDFGEVIDPPSADVTAHVVEMLAAVPGTDPAVMGAGRRWLEGQQEVDGSWFGRWGVNYIYGTGAAVPALVVSGSSPASSVVVRSTTWLVDHQNEDGGWGEDIRSYREPDWRGRGVSTPSQTAWALLALLAGGMADDPVTRRGVEWLVDRQLPDGGWDEPWYTGTGFPWDFSINYHLYRLVFPIMALGRYVEAQHVQAQVEAQRAQEER